MKYKNTFIDFIWELDIPTKLKREIIEKHMKDKDDYFHKILKQVFGKDKV